MIAASGEARTHEVLAALIPAKGVHGDAVFYRLRSVSAHPHRTGTLFTAAIAKLTPISPTLQALVR